MATESDAPAVADTATDAELGFCATTAPPDRLPLSQPENGARSMVSGTYQRLTVASHFAPSDLAASFCEKGTVR